MQSEPSSGIKLTAYSCICWLFHRIYYDARNHKHKRIIQGFVEVGCYIECEHCEIKGWFKNFYSKRILIWSTGKIILILPVSHITIRRGVKFWRSCSSVDCDYHNLLEYTMKYFVILFSNLMHSQRGLQATLGVSS